MPLISINTLFAPDADGRQASAWAELKDFAPVPVADADAGEGVVAGPPFQVPGLEAAEAGYWAQGDVGLLPQHKQQQHSDTPSTSTQGATV